MQVDPSRMTFGVELEFIVRYNPDEYVGKVPDADGKVGPPPGLHHKCGILVSLHMIRILNEYGFPTNGYKETNFSKWTVDTDGTVAPDDASGNWYAIELKTPVLSCCHSAFEQIETVVKLLVSKFKLYTNEKCGLHVHVGDESRGFTVPTLKNFCSLIAVFENQLDSLHPPERLENTYAKSTRKAFQPGTCSSDKLSIIDKLEDRESLIIRFHLPDNRGCNKHMAFNFLNLLESQEGQIDPLQTIEFRQHRGTLDPKLITNWAKVACNLVRMSFSDGAGFRKLIDKYMFDIKYTVIDLFEDLNMLELAKFYAPIVLLQHGSDPNQSVMDATRDEKLCSTGIPGKYETPWEKKFAPRPRSELGLCEHIPYPDTHPTCSEPQGNWDSQTSPNSGSDVHW